MVFTARFTINFMQTSSQKCAILLVCIKINYHGSCKQLILSDGMRFVVVFKCHCFKAQDSQILWFWGISKCPGNLVSRGGGGGGLGRSWNWPMHKRFYFLRRHIVWSGGTLAHHLIYFVWWPANNDFSLFPFAGILEEKPIKNILNDEYFSSITDEMEMSWKSKHDGKSVNESLKEYLVEYVGKPITDLFRYVSRLWHQLLW